MSLRKRVVTFDSEELKKKESFSELSKVEELKGKLQFNFLDGSLMHAVLDNDKDAIKEGRLASESLNYRIQLNAELLFEELVKNYKNAKQIYGKSFITELTGFSDDYVENNIRIPEFQRELKKRIEDRIKSMNEHGLLKEDSLTEKGIELSAFINYVEELEAFVTKGLLGEKVSKKKSVEGAAEETTAYKKQRYKDLAVQRSISIALRRGHNEISKDDLRVFERKSKGSIKIIYALDASGSMRGEKIEQCKRAGIALAYKAVSERDKIGLIVFGSDIKKSISPTNDFTTIIKEIAAIKPFGETDIAGTISEASKIFSQDKSNVTKHLIIITDAMPTKGAEPEKETLKAASAARSSEITISIVGIKLDKKGNELAEQIAKIGNGRFYTARSVKDIDKIILEDYYAVQSG